MTAKEVIDGALERLGYNQSDTPAKRGLNALNDVYAEVFYTEHWQGEAFRPVKKLTEILDISQFAAFNCIIYGVAAALALSENDCDNQNYYAQIYNDKLRQLPKRTPTRIDANPTPEGADV